MKIKKILSAIVLNVALLLPFSGIGQSDNPNPVTFPQGVNVLSLGVGIGGTYDGWGPGYTQTPEFVLSYENGTFGNVGPGTISLGALVAYTGTSYTYYDGNSGFSYSNRWNYWVIGFRSAYHWNFTSSAKFDPYAGLMLGYYVVNYSHTTNDPYAAHPGDPGYVYYESSYPNYVSLSLFIGARYYLSDKVAIWAELGYGYSNLALGVSFKL